MLFQFVREALQNDWLPFELRASGGQKLEENEALALNECGLVSWGCAHGITAFKRPLAEFSILDRILAARVFVEVLSPLVGLYCFCA